MGDELVTSRQLPFQLTPIRSCPLYRRTNDQVQFAVVFPGRRYEIFAWMITRHDIDACDHSIRHSNSLHCRRHAFYQLLDIAVHSILRRSAVGFKRIVKEDMRYKRLIGITVFYLEMRLRWQSCDDHVTIMRWSCDNHAMIMQCYELLKYTLDHTKIG